MIIPALDILQSVPVLGFLTFTVIFFLALFPGSAARRRTRRDLRDLHQPGLEHGVHLLSVAAHGAARPRRSLARFQPSPWQRFWRLEAPFAAPGLIWNTMMSMSGGWFFVVASEAITVGDTHDRAAGHRLVPRDGHRARKISPRSAGRWARWRS